MFPLNENISAVITEVGVREDYEISIYSHNTGNGCEDWGANSSNSTRSGPWGHVTLRAIESLVLTRPAPVFFFATGVSCRIQDSGAYHQRTIHPCSSASAENIHPRITSWKRSIPPPSSAEDKTVVRSHQLRSTLPSLFGSLTQEMKEEAQNKITRKRLRYSFVLWACQLLQCKKENEMRFQCV